MWVLYGSFHGPCFCRWNVLLRWFVVCRRVCVYLWAQGGGEPRKRWRMDLNMFLRKEVVVKVSRLVL